MQRHTMQTATTGLAILAVLCWTVMFLAGTDVWHFTGRPDFWTRQGPPFEDLRAFADAFYVLSIVLATQLILAIVSSRRWQRG